MRAARLLRILLILQNRGRCTAGRLAAELEVAPHTFLRNVDALTEAGWPVVMHRGVAGGIELAFDDRTRLTGLDAEEAEAMGVILSQEPQRLADLGLSQAAARAQAKTWEAFPDRTRAQDGCCTRTVPHRATRAGRCPPAGAGARGARIVRLNAFAPDERVARPVALTLAPGGWPLHDGLTGGTVAEAAWGRINISAHRFDRGNS